MTVTEQYHNLIVWIVGVSQQSEDALHIHAGLTVLVIAQILTRRSFGTMIPFVFVVAAEVLNEFLDYLYPTGWTALGSAVDFANTLFWPLAISIGVRWRPMIMHGYRSLGSDEVDESS